MCSQAGNMTAIRQDLSHCNDLKIGTISKSRQTGMILLSLLRGIVDYELENMVENMVLLYATEDTKKENITYGELVKWLIKKEETYETHGPISKKLTVLFTNGKNAQIIPIT
jgi:hypothetical protein